MHQIAEKIYWVGIKDWELRLFHGEEYTTHRGSTYNAYVIKDEKTALVDTVWTPFKEEFISALDRDIGLHNIDLVVVNHTEADHGGSLTLLMEKIPETPIYCTKKGAEMIKKYFHRDWNFKIVKTGDTVDLGEYKLVFIEAPMLHWPDSMMTYVQGPGVLLSNDAFGQHYATPQFFNDQVDRCELYQEAMKYYANILTPFSKLVRAKIDELKALNVPVNMIAPSHGVIWRDNPIQIVEKYYEWANNYHEGTVTIIYNTMWGSTKKMALAVAEGIESVGIPTKVFNLGKSDRNDVVTEVFKAKGILVASSVINNGILSDTAAILEMFKGLKFKNKVGAAFGSYGWSGENVKIIEDALQAAGIEVVLEGIKVKYNPTEEELALCKDFGRRFGEKILSLGENNK